MWIPSITKIVDFGIAWLNSMKIPETSDFVLGEDDPGGTPVAIGSMGSASGQVFATLENNLQYLHDVMVLDDVTINVTNVTELQAALDILDRVTHVHKDKTFAINLAAGTYVWPIPATETRSALHVYGVHGAGNVVFTATGTVTIEGNGTTARPLASVVDCTCNVVFSGTFVLSNDLNGGARGMTLDNVRQFTALSLEVKNKASGNTLLSAVYCREVDFADLGLTVNALAGSTTGITRAIFARQNSQVYFDNGNLTVGILTSEIIYLEKNSFVLFEDLDSCLPTGANCASLSSSVVVDSSSGIRANNISSSGSGTAASPFQITIAWESATDTLNLINRVIELLPKPLDVYVKLKLPANTMTDQLVISELYGGGRLHLEGNTALSAKGTTQDTIFDRGGTAVKIERCQLPILLHSLKCDSDTGTAGCAISECPHVRILFCYFVAATGAGSPLNGNGVYAEGVGTNVWSLSNKFGLCNQNGFHVTEGANLRDSDSDAVGGANVPQQYGNYARISGSIYRDDTTHVTGAVASDSEDTGGKVFGS